MTSAFEIGVVLIPLFIFLGLAVEASMWLSRNVSTTSFDEFRRTADMAGREAWLDYSTTRTTAIQFVAIGAMLFVVGFTWSLDATSLMVVETAEGGAAIQPPPEGSDPSGLILGPLVGAPGVVLVVVGLNYWRAAWRDLRNRARRRRVRVEILARIFAEIVLAARERGDE